MSSSRRAPVADSGSAERSGGKYWPGVAAVQLGVGGDGHLALGAGGGLPVGAVSHCLGEHGLALSVGLLQGPVAGSQLVLARGLVVVAAPVGGAGLGGGTQAGQAGVPGGGADLAELVPDVPGAQAVSIG